MVCRILSSWLYPLNSRAMSSIPGQSGFMWMILLLTCVLPHICSMMSESDKETCYSQQHRSVTVNIHLAVTKGTIMSPREKPSEKDCILTCCSEDVNPGVKCNRVVYKPPEESSSENCYLFFCPSEQDCPLMTAELGVNTYNIFKGVTYPTTKVIGRAAAKPSTNLNPKLNTTTSTTKPPPTTMIKTPVATTTKPTITKLPITTTTSATPSLGPTTEASESPTEGPTELLKTASMTGATVATTTTTTTQSTTTTTTQPTMKKENKSTTTKACPPARPAAKPSRPRKPSTSLRGPETHSVKPTKAKTATTHPITSTAPSTTAPTTTSMAAPQTSAGTTVEIDSKERALKLDPLLPPVLGSAPVKPRFSRTIWKNSLVAVVVITLIFLLLILALVARKAMESFDRRHYTRLELNDLHYEV
ncbi:MANSC domain-containing protein 1 [Paramisgurnus dabryanus]|uniref:MANSC domain-containing protein 1 n=1 Tax=Paramisgurnus dabryanus TaxID=90735 RepID=UPI0031F44793